MIPKAFLGIKLKKKGKSDTESILETAYGPRYNQLTNKQRKALIKQYESDEIARESINQQAAQSLLRAADARADMDIAPVVDENRFTPDLTVPKEKRLYKNASYAESPKIIKRERPVVTPPVKSALETEEQVARRIIDTNKGYTGWSPRVLPTPQYLGYVTTLPTLVHITNTNPLYLESYPYSFPISTNEAIQQLGPALDAYYSTVGYGIRPSRPAGSLSGLNIRWDVENYMNLDNYDSNGRYYTGEFDYEQPYTYTIPTPNPRALVRGQERRKWVEKRNNN